MAILRRYQSLRLWNGGRNLFRTIWPICILGRVNAMKVYTGTLRIRLKALNLDIWLLNAFHWHRTFWNLSIFLGFRSLRSFLITVHFAFSLLSHTLWSILNNFIWLKLVGQLKRFQSTGLRCLRHLRALWCSNSGSWPRSIRALRFSYSTSLWHTGRTNIWKNLSILSCSGTLSLCSGVRPIPRI